MEEVPLSAVWIINFPGSETRYELFEMDNWRRRNSQIFPRCKAIPPRRWNGGAKQKERNKGGLLRRGFLKGAAATLATWGLLPNTIHMLGREGTPEPAQKVITRLYGIGTNLHPEDITNFFRNLIMANSMLMVAERMKKVDRKPNIGFNAGYEHGGLEDLIKAGPEFCKFLISNFPKELLQFSIKNSGSLENFCTAIVIDLPSNLTSQNLNNPEIALGLIKTNLRDDKLYQMLKSKGF